VVASASPLRVASKPRGTWVVLAVAGELDYSTCPVLTDRLDAVIDGQQRPRVAIDLHSLDFCDSSGIRCLILAWKRARGRDGDLVVLRPRAGLRARITSMGLADTLRMTDELPG
jgi:anti-sigma B factor antagonist